MGDLGTVGIRHAHDFRRAEHVFVELDGLRGIANDFGRNQGVVTVGYGFCTHILEMESLSLDAVNPDFSGKRATGASWMPPPRRPRAAGLRVKRHRVGRV